MALKTLEQDLGATLMERDAKNVRLTPAGEAFLTEARKVLAQLQHAADVVRGVAEGMQGRLDVGITGSMVYRQVPDFCRASARNAPWSKSACMKCPRANSCRPLPAARSTAAFST
jgi:DNA-binding transcriptional LysR family regulator